MTPRDGVWRTDKGSFAPRCDDMPVQTVISDQDLRRRVRPDSPFYDAVVQLQSFAVGETSPRMWGTGIFIGKGLVLTAAHLLFGARFGPGRAGYACRVSVTAPSAHQPLAWITSQMAVPGPYERDQRRHELDLGLLWIGDATTATPPVWEPVEIFENSAMGLDVTIIGYPTQRLIAFGASGRVVGVQSGLLYHRADTSEGQSGAPVFRQAQRDLQLFAIHRGGVDDTPPQYWPANGAVRLSSDAIEWMKRVAAILPRSPKC